MEPRKYLSDAVAAPPEAPAVPSVGYPTDGSDIGAQAATSPGAYWFYQIGESLRRIIVAAGREPDHLNLNLLLESIQGMANANKMPIGSIVIMSGNVVPSGFGLIKLNGFELLRGSYPGYWEFAEDQDNFVSQAVKDADPETYAGYYGDGDGSTTFTIPDWRGEFPRFWDDGRGIDPGRGIGSWQADEIKSHAHSLNTTTSTDNDDIGYLERAQPQSVQSIQTSAVGGVETRPRSLSAMALVRAY